MSAAAVWPVLSTGEIIAITGTVVGAFVACVIVLGWIWPVTPLDVGDSKKKPLKTYGTSGENGHAGDVEAGAGLIAFSRTCHIAGSDNSLLCMLRRCWR